MSKSSQNLPIFPKIHLLVAGGVFAAACVLVTSPIAVQAKVTPLELTGINQDTSPEFSDDTIIMNIGKALSDNASGEALPFVRSSSFSEIIESYTKMANQSVPIGPVIDSTPFDPLIESVELKPQWQTVTVKSGDTLSTLFEDLGLSSKTLHDVLSTDKEAVVFSRLRAGENLDFLINKSDDEVNLLGMKIKANYLESYHIFATDTGFEFHKEVLEPELRHRVASATIDSSLFIDARNAGLSQRLVTQMADVFGYDIDFSRHIRKGDKFEVLYEEKHIDDKTVGYGKILAARFENRGKTYTAIRYTHRDGSSSYYRADGSSMKRAFIRTPVEFARISSRFNPNRRHPVLNKIRPHKGVDYAASTGTPIRSTGVGRVVHIGNKGGYGRTVVIKHGKRYQTLYAHMNRYASGLRVGSQVDQGQVIGYVGMSGLATGPHLHYEFLVNGRHVDPLSAQLPAADPIPQGEKPSFMNLSKQLMAKLDNSGNNMQLSMRNQ